VAVAPDPNVRVDEAIASALRGRLARSEDSRREPCPGENVLAAMALGGLLPEEREAAERHVAGCDACLDVVGTIARAEPPAAVATVPAPAPRRRVLTWLAIAAGLAGVGLLGRDILERSSSPRALLTTAAADLSASRPDLFAGFTPLDDAELADDPRVRLRGGTQLQAPVGTILEARPTLEWTTSRGGGGRHVEVHDAETDALVAEATCESPCAYPAQAQALEPGHAYAWSVTIDGPFGAEVSTQRFAVASDAERTGYEEASGEIDRVVPERVRELVRAHVALRRGLDAEASRAAQRYVEESPDDPLGRQTLALARKREARDD
jgi:hypothetical protein